MITQERIIICGTNGVGKSTIVNKLIDSTMKAAPNKKALAVLYDDSEPIFFPYKDTELRDLHLINKNIVDTKFKIFFDDNKIYDSILKSYTNGVLVFDDAGMYVGMNDIKFKRTFIRSRQNNLHVFFVCHGLSEIPPCVFTYATKMILFNTTDTWKRNDVKIPNPDKFDMLVNAVRAKANDHKGACPCINNSQSKCTCGAGYHYKVIDMKKDLL